MPYANKRVRCIVVFFLSLFCFCYGLTFFPYHRYICRRNEKATLHPLVIVMERGTRKLHILEKEKDLREYVYIFSSRF